MPVNSLTTEGARIAIAALTGLNPYLALLRDLPDGGDDVTSPDILAEECSRGGYNRLRITNWIVDMSARPPRSYNAIELATDSVLSGATDVLTHFALVQTQSGTTGTIYSVGVLESPLSVEAGQQIRVPIASVIIHGGNVLNSGNWNDGNWNEGVW